LPRSARAQVYADACRRMLTYADVCRRMLTYVMLVKNLADVAEKRSRAGVC
jgi:hypothetical protein